LPLHGNKPASGYRQNSVGREDSAIGLSGIPEDQGECPPVRCRRLCTEASQADRRPVIEVRRIPGQALYFGLSCDAFGRARRFAASGRRWWA
jgi:hypothetical protein